MRRRGHLASLPVASDPTLLSLSRILASRGTMLLEFRVIPWTNLLLGFHSIHVRSSPFGMWRSCGTGLKSKSNAALRQRIGSIEKMNSFMVMKMFVWMDSIGGGSGSPRCCLHFTTVCFVPPPAKQRTHFDCDAGGEALISCICISFVHFQSELVS
jgi:hypothetical protein